MNTKKEINCKDYGTELRENLDLGNPNMANEQPSSVKDFYEEALTIRKKVNGCGDSKGAIIKVFKEYKK